MKIGTLCAMTLVVVTAASSAPAQTTFRTEIDVVTVGVTVLDKKGGFITDLTQEDFEIVEDGQTQTIKYFAKGDDDATAPELHLGLLFDTSGSMDQDLKFSRTAAIKFLNTLPHALDMTLVDFDTEVRVARYGQADFPRMVERIRRRRADGWTALYDALGVYLDGTDGQRGRKILVIYTDGGDTRSTMSYADALTAARASDATVYAIGLLEHQPTSVRSEQRMRLQRIAETTGGQAFFPSAEKELDAAYAKVLAEMRAQYSLGYHSTNLRSDGAWRKVEIKLKRPDVRNAKIRARKGYFAPYKESSQP